MGFARDGARAVLGLWLVGSAGCGGGGSGNEQGVLPVSHGQGPAPFDPGQTYAPDVSADELKADVDHPLFPLPVGARWVYEAQTEDGLERTEVSVEPGTKQLWGKAEARVVHDTLYLDGTMTEDTHDWFAQDAAGNVWYVGEATVEYENGKVTTTAGSWEAGVKHALPGVIMLKKPVVSDVYRQEYLAGEAEDLSEVVSLNESVTVPAGSWKGCLKTRELSAIEPDVEYKFYCPGVGVALELEGNVRVELKEYSGL